MGRYQASAGDEGKMEPGSRRRVLHNRLGIKRKVEMDQVEFDLLVAAQKSWLKRITDETGFSAQMLCQMHRDWLERVYGNYRNVELAKGAFHWPPARLVAQNMMQLEQNFLRPCTPCKPDILAKVALRVATVHAELLLVHPFRDGNGRLARWLADLMFLQAGYPLPDYRFVGVGSRRNRARYLAGVQHGYLQNYRLLADFFADTVARRL
jgi:cell filamentation protein